MRRIIQWVVIVLLIAYVVVSFTQIQSIIETLKLGNPIFLLAAFLFEILCLINAASVYSSLYQLVGLRETRWNLFLMSTAATFISVIAPSGGVGGMAIFIDSAKKRKLSSGRVLVVGILYLLYEYASLLCVVMLGFVVLVRRGHLDMGQISAALFMLAIAVADGIVLYLGYKSQHRLGKLLTGAARLVNRLLRRFIHKDAINTENAYNLSVEIAEGIKTITSNPKKIIWPFLFDLNNKAILICIMSFVFLALGIPFSTGTIIGAVSLGQLFYYISPTPGGIGVVESLFPLILKTLGVPIAKGLLITLTYRAIMLWFPLLVGFISFRVLLKRNAKKKINEPLDEAAALPVQEPEAIDIKGETKK